MYAILFGMSILYTFQSLFCKLYTDRSRSPRDPSPAFSVIYGFVVSILTLAMGGFSYHPSRTTVLFGLINSVCLCINSISLVQASKRGPYSFVMICNLLCGMLIPSFVSMIAFDQALRPIQWFGVVLTVIAFVLINFPQKKTSDSADSAKKPNGWFFFFAFLLGISNGAYGSLLTLHAGMMDGAERTEMVVTTFFFSGVVSLIYMMLNSRKPRVFAQGFAMGKRALMFALLACVCATSAANLQLWMLSRMNNTVVHACNNVTVLVLSVLASFVLFKEKMRKVQIVGVGLSVAAILLLTL